MASLYRAGNLPQPGMQGAASPLTGGYAPTSIRCRQPVTAGDARGGQPLDWGPGGCAPNLLHFRAAAGGTKTTNF
ncbi:hypothetical protein [Dictyobacter kobayashii]|uniref:hypothetical protein n=1 Tax=Dictyobacter kobayashii TaxID=2014872 RepID=UPI0010A961BE|nr:hypothetical protein [Dictyobacter kobayashii]